jgi:predicted nucleic-acid-binding Zn-ribbon protein
MVEQFEITIQGKVYKCDECKGTLFEEAPLSLVGSKNIFKCVKCGVHYKIEPENI